MTDALFESHILATREATMQAFEGCDVDHVCMSISVRSSLAGFGLFRFSASEAQRLGRVKDIGKIARAAGRRSPAGANPWVVLATSPAFVFADLSCSDDDDVVEAALAGPAAVPPGDVSTQPRLLRATHDHRGRLLRALSAQGGNTFQVHSTCS
jgi:hypothetical protein